MPFKDYLRAVLVFCVEISFIFSQPVRGQLHPSVFVLQRYSAASLRSITTEMLKVLNATEDLLQGVEGGDDTRRSTVSLPPNSDPKKLDQQLWRLEENVTSLLIFIHLFMIKMFLFSVYYLTMNVYRYVWLQVYVAAGSVYSLEAELSDLEECARGICSSTSDMKLSFLEEQVAAAAATVQQSELQVTRATSLIF